MGAVPGTSNDLNQEQKASFPFSSQRATIWTPMPTQSSSPLIQPCHLDHAYLSWRCHSWGKLTISYQRALFPVKIWRNRCKSGSTLNIWSLQHCKNCEIIANVSKLKDSILKYFTISFAKLGNLASAAKAEKPMAPFRSGHGYLTSHNPSTYYYSLTLRPGISCHKSFLFILWVWNSVIKRSMKYFLHPCLYQKCRKERAVSLKERGSEHISWWKCRFFSCDYCHSVSAPNTQSLRHHYFGGGWKSSLLLPLHHLLYPCRRLTSKFLLKRLNVVWASSLAQLPTTWP